MGVLALAVAFLALAAPLDAQVLPIDPSTTTTTTSTTTTSTTTSTTLLPDGTTTTTAPPAGADPSTTTAPAPSSDPAPPPDAGPNDGDGGHAADPGSIPPEAQRVVDSVVRTPPNGSQALYDAIQPLVDLGLSREEAIRIGFGRFPVAGVARYSHDWLYPRYGPAPGQLRFHRGTDIFAAYGTPLRAVVDGIARTSNNGLGGLTVKVYDTDGTYYYYAHLSRLADGFTSGMPVKTGDIIGYIGDSGNAKGGAPHVHFGIYPRGGDATDPKPVLDQFLAEAMQRLPALIEQVRAGRAATPPADPSTATLRPIPAPWLLRSLHPLDAVAEVPTEVLYQATVNPSAGGTSVARAEAEQLAASIDWDRLESRNDAGLDLLRRTAAVLDLALGTRTGS